MTARIDQAPVVVLAVQLDQPAGQFAQQRDAHRLVVDKRLAAAARIITGGLELALEDQRLARLDLDTGLVERTAHGLGQVREFEAGRHARPVLAGAYQAAVGAVAQHQTQRIEQDRLASPGLTGEHAEPTGKIEIQRLDQHDVADGKAGEHVRLPF